MTPPIASSVPTTMIFRVPVVELQLVWTARTRQSFQRSFSISPGFVCLLRALIDRMQKQLVTRCLQMFPNQLLVNRTLPKYLDLHLLLLHLAYQIQLAQHCLYGLIR